MSESTDNNEARLRIRLERNLHTAILASRHTPDTGQIARLRRALRRHILNVRRRAAANSNSNSHELSTVHSHFSLLQNRRSAPAPARPLLGVCAFNAPDLYIPETTSFRYPYLNDPNNFTCQHCGAQLWWEERSLNCCNSGAAAIPRLRPVSDQIWRLFNTNAFSTSQRNYNVLFSFTALAAGGCESKTWTNPAPPSMLTLHGKAYHLIFDLQEKYHAMNVSNSARFTFTTRNL